MSLRDKLHQFNEIKLTKQELEEYHQVRAQQDDQEEREKGRFQFDTVIVMGTLAVLCYVFVGSAGIYGIIGISIASLFVWLSKGFGSWN